MIVETVCGHGLQLWTEPGLFSQSSVDAGTLAMLSCVTFGADDKVLDLGCGYGVVGIVAAKTAKPENVFLVDVDPVAVSAARQNIASNGVGGATVARSDGFRDFHETGFTKILSNPPYHADFAVPKHFIEKGFNRLALGGSMFMVTRRELWYRRKLEAIFGGVRTRTIDGYFVFEAIKKASQYANTAAKRPAH
ncbi:MAG TPA: methyltransferase [Caulobacteraceae bacterium]|nr:methyltransferase [Caulobacteraceae bacterium]